MRARSVVLLACLLTLSMFAGCAERSAQSPDALIEKADAQPASVKPLKPPTPWSAPHSPQTTAALPTAPPRSPVTFSGRVLAPDVFLVTYGYDCGDGGPYDQAVAGMLLQSFPFEESYDNWSFVFDSPGFEADFDQRYSVGYYDSEYFGKVPPSSTGVTVCGRHQMYTEFELTLIPPTSKVLSGRALLPSSCDAASRFILDGAYDSWTYAFNTGGVVAKFYGKHWLGGGTEGTVPDGAWAVAVCSESTPNVAFSLILTPPATQGTAPGAQHYAGAWYAGVVRSNAPCMSNGLPIPSDPVADGVLYDSFRINPATRGQPYRIQVDENIAEDLPWLMPGVFVSFYDSAGEEVRGSVVPDEATRGVLWSCETGPVRARYIAGPFVG